MATDSAIKRAEKKLEYISDEDALALYRAREDSAHERANLLYTGREEGRMEGKTEERLEIAQKMLAENASLDFINKVTGLSVEELKALQAKGNGRAN
jgi:predicted transposase/invertase (TIGR01784 family)